MSTESIPNMFVGGQEKWSGTPSGDYYKYETNPSIPLLGDSYNRYHGLAGNDTLWGDNANDTISGDEGNDELHGSGGNDYLIGVDGNDSLFGDSGNDLVYGGDGDDLVTGQEGNDTLYGNHGLDTLSGDAGDDFLDGGTLSGKLHGGDGNDTIYGGGDFPYDAGNSIILTGHSHDRIWGDAGNDEIYGLSGDDTIYGGTGDDILSGGLGENIIYGGDGNDVFYTAQNDGRRDLYTGGEGIDTFFVGTEGGSDNATGIAAEATGWLSSIAGLFGVLNPAFSAVSAGSGFLSKLLGLMKPIRGDWDDTVVITDFEVGKDILVLPKMEQEEIDGIYRLNSGTYPGIKIQKIGDSNTVFAAIKPKGVIDKSELIHYELKQIEPGYGSGYDPNINTDPTKPQPLLDAQQVNPNVALYTLIDTRA